MTLHVSVGGVNKRVIAIWVGVNGVWKRVLGGWTSVAGVYKKFLTSSTGITNPLAGGVISSLAYDGADNTSYMTIHSDGSLSADSGAITEKVDTISGTRWFDGPPDQTYEVFATLLGNSGTGTTSGTFGTWLPMTSDRTWFVEKVGGVNGARTCSVKFKFRRQSDSVVVSPDTNAYNISCATNVGSPP